MHALPGCCGEALRPPQDRDLLITHTALPGWTLVAHTPTQLDTAPVPRARQNREVECRRQPLCAPCSAVGEPRDPNRAEPSLGKWVSGQRLPHTGPLGKSPSSGIRRSSHAWVLAAGWLGGHWGDSKGSRPGCGVGSMCSYRQVHSRVTDRPTTSGEMWSQGPWKLGSR